MGKSPSIQSLESQDDAFRAYLQEQETQLQSKSGSVDAELQAKINEFYTNGGYTDGVDVVSGQNFDFMLDSEFSLDNLKTMIEAISSAVFAGGLAPPGAEVDADGQQAAAAKLGPEVGGLANLEPYMAGQVFNALSTSIISFGTSADFPFSTDLQSQPLGYGLQLFAAFSAQSCQSPSFFNNESLYEYLCAYDVRFSAQQSNSEPSQSLITLYEDQIAAFRQQEQDLMTQLENGTLTEQAYASANEAYDALIAADQAKLAALQAEAGATG